MDLEPEVLVDGPTKTDIDLQMYSERYWGCLVERIRPLLDRWLFLPVAGVCGRRVKTVFQRCKQDGSGWLDEDKTSWVFDRLGLTRTHDRAELANPDTLVGWQAYLLGVLYRKDTARFSSAVTSVFTDAQADVLYQLIRPVRRVADMNPPEVVAGLASRIRSINTSYSTDTDLFSVLAELSPPLLLELVRSNEWQTWMVEGRAALCEAATLALKHQTKVDAGDLVIPFVRDSAFQVRRSAYRVLSDVGHERLYSVCKLWTDSRDVELERRAAEMIEWLPTNLYPDDVVRSMEFQSHPEPAVREAFEGVLSRRRQRTWAEQYTDALFAMCRSRPIDVAESFRLSRALTKFGDDETIRRIQAFVGGESLTIGVRNLLKRTTIGIEKQWKQTTSKWPGLWSHEDGDIEEVDGKFVLVDGSEISAKVTLWRKHRHDQSEKYSWGGLAVDLSSRFGFLNDDRNVTLEICGRPNSKVLVGNVRSTSRIGTEFRFNGQSEYPQTEKALAPQQLFLDKVVAVFSDAELELSTEVAEQIAKRIQPIAEGSDLSAILNPQVQTQTTSLNLLEVALVLRIVGDEIRNSPSHGITLWQLTNRLLSIESRELRLLPTEFNEFVSLVLAKDENLTDELVVWLGKRLSPKLDDEVAHAPPKIR